ncbi:MAG: choice-of-anchor D domain-containing protein [Rubrobacter sp.]|nr:choice-of-anchor D domain-containing protein [Rubrobacter sp.]
MLLTNTGDEDVTIEAIGTGGSNAGQFVVQELAPTTLKPDEAVPVEVGFKPSMAGEKSARIVVDHNRSGTPVETQVSGNGTQANRPDIAKPTISGMAPGPNMRTAVRRPAIRAVVRDDRSELKRSQIKFFVDGRPTAFSYNPANGRLFHRARLLPHGRHVVRVVAVEDAGNRQVRAWSFHIVKPRR